MKPILFSTKMVQAILAGNKTMTRRVIKFPEGMTGRYAPCGDRDYIYYPCGIKRPKYQVGDVLWVRETWMPETEQGIHTGGYIYKASDRPEPDGDAPLKWHPSIFMPKEAARISLRITGVRAERVQDILCGDMKREGCVPESVTGGQYQQWQRDYWIPLWDEINKKRGYGWDINPWVWVYEFERVEHNADLEDAQKARREHD